MEQVAELTHPQDTSDPDMIEESSSAPELERRVPPEAGATNEVPLALALLAQTRRVREQVLPTYYALAHGPQPDNAPKVNPTLAIILMNGALTTAEQAMMNQDGNQMMFAYHQLAAFNV